MNSAKEISHNNKSYLAYQVFKYSIYFFLCYNLYVFFIDDYHASSQTYPDGITLSNLVLAFATTIDTLSWIILLAVFELETWIIDDAKIKGATRWALNLIRAVCYIFIIYSAWGYTNKFLMLMDYTAFSIDDVCALINSSYTQIITLDDYVPITMESCQILNQQELFQITGTNIISARESLDAAIYLALIDIVNSYAWLIIVAILEVDVYLQLKGKFTGFAFTSSKLLKMAVYSLLFVCAVLWGIDGAFIDFWDAFLWLLAFFFIEMNIFEWHAETEKQNASTS
ncbi:MAG: hypothetical protein VW882_10555 [Gammaproteobacteria bacterium]